MILLLLGFLYIHLQEFDSQNLWHNGFIISPKAILFLPMFSILGSMWLHSRALYILAAMDVRVIPR